MVEGSRFWFGEEKSVGLHIARERRSSTPPTTHGCTVASVFVTTNNAAWRRRTDAHCCTVAHSDSCTPAVHEPLQAHAQLDLPPLGTMSWTSRSSASTSSAASKLATLRLGTRVLRSSHCSLRPLERVCYASASFARTAAGICGSLDAHSATRAARSAATKHRTQQATLASARGRTSSIEQKGARDAREVSLNQALEARVQAGQSCSRAGARQSCADTRTRCAQCPCRKKRLAIVAS